MKPVLARLAEKRGVHRESYRAGEMTDMFSPWRPMTDAEKQELERETEAIYDIFLDEVARGRGLTRSEVEAVAGGRIWLGREAVANRLVDGIGSVEDAVEAAAALAGIRPEYRTLYFTGQKVSWLTRLATGVEYVKTIGGVVTGGDADAGEVDVAD